MVFNPHRMPGIHTGPTATARKVLVSDRNILYVPGGVIIDGSKARDPLNSNNVNTLRAGMLLGKITASGKYAPSIIGVTGEAVDSAETEITVAAAVVTELVRRIGASGTFRLTGPPTAGGTVQTLTATYSAASGTTITLTALGTAAVWTLTPVSGTDGGTFRLAVTTEDGNRQITGPITFSATGATFQSNIDTAIEALSNLPDDACSVASTDTTGVSTMTFLASLGNVQVEVVNDNLTDGGVHEGEAALVHTTTGVNGEFVTGSLIQPTDGSETPLVMIADQHDTFGIKTVDDNDDSIDVQLPSPVIGGFLDASQIINYPADAALKQWVKDKLNAVGSFAFDDDF